MERRSEPRTSTQQPAILQILGRECGNGIEATLEDSSGQGIRLRTRQPVPGNAAVQVETAGLLILGDVCRCVRAAEDGESYYVAVKVAHRLSLLKELRALHQALADQPQQGPVSTRA